MKEVTTQNEGDDEFEMVVVLCDRERGGMHLLHM